jgi:hypothetical protein
LVSAAKPAEVDLKLRIPYWVKNGSVKVNGRALPAFADAGSYQGADIVMESISPTTAPNRGSECKRLLAESIVAAPAISA